MKKLKSRIRPGAYIVEVYRDSTGMIVTPYVRKITSKLKGIRIEVYGAILEVDNVCSKTNPVNDMIVFSDQTSKVFQIKDFYNVFTVRDRQTLDEMFTERLGGKYYLYE